MAYKPFPMEDPKTNRWNHRIKGPAQIKHKEIPVSDLFKPGVSMKARSSGVPHFRRVHAVYEPEPLARKKPSQAQLNASYCRFLEEQGWTSLRIATYLNVKRTFVHRVLAMDTYKGCGPVKPPKFGESSDAA